MKSRWSKIITLLITALMIPSLSYAVDGDGADLSQAETILFELMNKGRTAPLETAASLGLDPEKVLADLPELTEILVNGLPAFSRADLLTRVARSHSQEMLANGYYSHEDLDGGFAPERIANSGYAAEMTGETLGMLAFLNYVEAERAAKALFEHIFLDELNPDRSEPRWILVPDLTDAGVGVAQGQMTLEGRTFNAYVATCNYAKPTPSQQTDSDMVIHVPDLPFELMAGQLINLINQNRTRTGNSAEGTEDTLAPFGMSTNLMSAAQQHAEDMIGRYYFASTDPDGRALSDRLISTGYSLTDADELLVWIPVPGNRVWTAEGLVEALYAALEWGSFEDAENPLLRIDLTEIGVGLGAAIQGGGGHTKQTVLIAVIDVAARNTGDKRYISGILFQDENGSGLYEPGEELPGERMIIYGAGLHLDTNAAGGYNALVPRGAYLTIWFDPARLQYRQVDVETHNQWSCFDK